MGCHFLPQRIFLAQDWTSVYWISCLAGKFFTTESPGKLEKLHWFFFNSLSQIILLESNVLITISYIFIKIYTLWNGPQNADLISNLMLFHIPSPLISAFFEIFMVRISSLEWHQQDSRIGDLYCHPHRTMILVVTSGWA